jgi:hypothetical protein
MKMNLKAELCILALPIDSTFLEISLIGCDKSE